MSDATVDLVLAVARNLSSDNDDWTAFSVSIGMGDGVISTEGYLYNNEGYIGPASVTVRDIRDALSAYLASHFDGSDPRPAALLVQFDRDLGAYNIDFEYEDEDRWAITPDKIDRIAEIREELRPRL